uniref:Uncharacterized protein n=1 Tax=Glossina austeni TaxID=7395 RepID=A0A1A9VI96_GLOAU
MAIKSRKSPNLWLAYEKQASWIQCQLIEELCFKQTRKSPHSRPGSNEYRRINDCVTQRFQECKTLITEVIDDKSIKRLSVSASDARFETSKPLGKSTLADCVFTKSSLRSRNDGTAFDPFAAWCRLRQRM